MMRSRRMLHLAGIVALAAMLFAQAAFALAACAATDATSTMRVIAVQGAQGAPCHQPAENSNLCLTHCQGAEQTLDKHQVKLPELSHQAGLAIPHWREARKPLAWLPRLPSPVAGPPPRILFRTLLI
jgi:hypothetical protein